MFNLNQVSTKRNVRICNITAKVRLNTQFSPGFLCPHGSIPGRINSLLLIPSLDTSYELQTYLGTGHHLLGAGGYPKLDVFKMEILISQPECWEPRDPPFPSYPSSYLNRSKNLTLYCTACTEKTCKLTCKFNLRR